MHTNYRIIEPHPTPKTNVVFSGRGGFGNATRKDKLSLTDGPTASGPPSLARLNSSNSTTSTSSNTSASNRYYLSGRGGAGNALPGKERAIFSFDEELAAQSRMMEAAAPVYHVGRGGAGNAVDDRTGHGQSCGSDASSASSTWSSVHGEKKKRSFEAAWGRVSKTFTR